MSNAIGLFETLGKIGFGIAGLYMGYQLGSDGVEYARTITENQDVLSYVINQHPTITKLTTTIGVSVVMSKVGSHCGLVDLVFGTYTKND